MIPYSDNPVCAVECFQEDPDRAFLEKFNHHFRRIERELNSTFGSRVPLIEDIGRHSLLGEGKRIRPLLCILSSRLCGYDGEDIYHISTLFEYLHSASLLHDDVIDNADMRRKKPSACHIWGNTAAVLAGDYLSTMAYSIAVGSNNMEIFKTATDTTARMVEGQLMELIHTHNWSISKNEYMDIIIAKTAELMSASCACGAIIAGAPGKEKECLQKFGMNLGIAFQLVDDLLDYSSSGEKFGKPVGKDLKEGKTTLPLIYALVKMGRKEANKLENLFKNHLAGEKDHLDLIRFVRSSGVIEEIRSEAVEYVERASEFLELFPESTYKNDLLHLNEYIAKRRF